MHPPSQHSATPSLDAMLCQSCGAVNPQEREYCLRCHQRLLVISGPMPIEEAENIEIESIEEAISFDEHLLERISILEEAVKRTTETVRQLLDTLHKQERHMLVNQTGVTALRELLETKGLIGREEWNELWEARTEHLLSALEKQERFLAIHKRVAALYQGGDRPAFLDRLAAAERSLLSFDVEEALYHLEAAWRLDPDNYELARFLGETFFHEGDPERALGYFESILDLRPDHYEALVYGGVLRHQRGEDQPAEELLERAVKLYPESFLATFSLGAVYAGQQELARAAAHLERAVEIDPVPQALYLLGHCCYEMGKLGAAIRTLRQAVHRDPTFEDAYHLLGLAYLDRRWHRKALDAFRQAQRLNPKRLQYRDLVSFLSGDAGSALPQVRGEAAGWFRRGETALARGRGREALGAYRRALACEPENPTLLMSCAMLCLQLDRYQEIEPLARKVIDLAPGEMLEAAAWATLIEALRSQGKFKEGNRIGRELLERETSGFTRTIASYEMACNLAEMEEDLDAALSYAHESLELAPDELKAFPLAAVGWVHYKRREYDRAIDFLTRSTELGPSAVTLTHLGMALLASGHEEQARTVLAHAHELQPSEEALGGKMLEVMKESARLLERVRSRRRK